MIYTSERYSIGTCEQCGESIYNCDTWHDSATSDGSGGVEHVMVCDYCANSEDYYDDFPMSLEYDDDWDHGQYDDPF